MRCFSSHLGAGGNQLLLSGEGELVDYMHNIFLQQLFQIALSVLHIPPAAFLQFRWLVVLMSLVLLVICVIIELFKD